MAEPNVCLAEFRKSIDIDYWGKGEKRGMDTDGKAKQVASTVGMSAQLQGPCSSYNMTLNLLDVIRCIP